MGSTCSCLGQRSQSQVEKPPPYEPSQLSLEVVDQRKEEAPALSSHPALRDRQLLEQLSITTQFQDSESCNPSFNVLHANRLQHPDFAHLRSPLQGTHRLRELITPPLTVAEVSHTLIVAATVPLWRWTNTQCQTWIAAVLVELAGKTTPEAKALAAEFKGWGPNLYIKEWKDWNSWLGSDGQAIFALLMQVHRRTGAVPTNVEIPHYALETKK